MSSNIWGTDLNRLGSHDIIGHVTIRPSERFPLGGPLTPTLYLTSLLTFMRHLLDKRIPIVNTLDTI